jgi:hypothetical protein
MFNKPFASLSRRNFLRATSGMIGAAATSGLALTRAQAAGYPGRPV